MRVHYAATSRPLGTPTAPRDAYPQTLIEGGQHTRPEWVGVRTAKRVHWIATSRA